MPKGKNKAIKRQGLIEAIKYYNSLQDAAHKLDEDIEGVNLKDARRGLSIYIDLIDEDGNFLNPKVGRGAPSQPDIIQSTPPPLLYDDIKNDPYFITA